MRPTRDALSFFGVPLAAGMGAPVAGQVPVFGGTTWAPGSGNPATVPQENGGRLTLASGVPVPTTDQLTKTVLYWTPWRHNRVTLYDGTAWVQRTSAEVSLNLATADGGGQISAAKNYDVFGTWSGGALVLSVGAAWTNDTTRAAAGALGTQDGRVVLASDTQKLWLGALRASAAGQCEDSGHGGTSCRRFVWNAWNQVLTPNRTIDTNASCVVAFGSWAQIDAAANNTFLHEFVLGEAGGLEAELGIVATQAAGAGTEIAIALDAATSPAAGSTKNYLPTTASGMVLVADCAQHVAAGYHYVRGILQPIAANTTVGGGMILGFRSRSVR